MASDWAQGTTIRPAAITVEFDDYGAPVHVGVGYHIVLPSGKVVAPGGYTWNVPTPHRVALTLLIKQLMADACKAEGVTNPLKGG